MIADNKPCNLWMRELALRFFLIAFSGLLFFGVAEIVCRLLFPDTQLRYVTDSEALYYFEPNQAGVITLADGSRSIPIRINQLGFRGPEISEHDRRRILVLGDSFTFGAGVSDEGTFAAQLDRAIGDSTTIVNGGQPGYGVFQMAATLRRVGGRIRPDLVIVTLWQGDLLRQAPDTAGRDRFFRRSHLLQLVKSSVFLTHIGRRLERLLVQVGAGNHVFHVGEGNAQSGLTLQAIVDAHLRGFEADAPRLLEMHREAQRYGRGLLLVLWPKEDFAHMAEPGLAQQLTDSMGIFARQHGIPFISVQPAMRRTNPASLLIPNDWHPTPLAHCLAARHIAAELVRLGFELQRTISCAVSKAALSSTQMMDMDILQGRPFPDTPFEVKRSASHSDAAPI